MSSHPSQINDSGSEAPVRVPLATLAAGSRARVCCQLTGDADAQLLCAMGLTEQSELRVCHSGGRWGRRCIVQVGGTRLGLCRAMTQRIMVEPVDQTAGA